MKIKQTKSRKSLIISLIILFSFILLIAAYFVYIQSQNQNISNSNESKVNLTPPTSEQKTAGDEIKDNSINNQGSTSPESVVNISITAANQNSSLLQIRTLIEAVISTGKCTLTLTKNSNVITKVVAVQALSSSSTCAGFDIPTSELSVGTWQSTVDFKNDTLKGTASRSIEIK